MSTANYYNVETGAMGYFITRADFARLSPAAQAEVRSLFAPAPTAAPRLVQCYVHPPPPAPGMPPALSYSANSRGEYGLYCPGCTCPPDIVAAREERIAEAGAAIAAGGGEESPLPAALGPAHNTSAWDRMRAAAEELEEAIETSRVTELAAFEATVRRCAYQLEVGNPIVERANARLAELRRIDAGLSGAAHDAWMAAGAPEEDDRACGCRGRYCDDCWPGGYESDH